jgi:hypothetical protein
MPFDWLVRSLPWGDLDDSGMAAGERLGWRGGTTEARVGSMVIVMGLAAGQATAGAAV